MHRRVLIWLFGGIAALPFAVAAQQPKKIPHVVHFSPVAFPSAVENWRKLLREIGYVEGRNIHFESRDTGGKVDRLPALAEKLAQEGDIDVILAESTPAALAAHGATQTISIVAMAAHDPVAAGLVQSLARPGGNVTGVSFFASETTVKRVELMREVVPRALRLATVTTKINEGAQSLGSALETGRKLGFSVEVITIDDPNNLAETLSPAILSEFDAFVFVPDVVLLAHKAEVINLISASNKPAIYETSAFVESGGFMSFGPDLSDVQRHLVAQLDRVLKGEKPGDLPFERATKFQLVINLAVARRLGIELSPSLLARADKVVER